MAPVRPLTRRRDALVPKVQLENAKKLNANQVLLPSSSYEGTIVWWGGGVLPEDVMNASTVCLLRPPARLHMPEFSIEVAAPNSPRLQHSEEACQYLYISTF